VTGRSRKSADAVLIAYDGVIWRPDAAAVAEVERRAGLEPGTIQSVAQVPERLVRGMLGEISRAAWCESIAAGLVGHAGGLEAAEKIVEEWYGVRGALVPELLDLLATVRERGVPVGVCTSGIDDVPADLADRVDAVVDAVGIGSAVPHPEFFLAGCRALGVPPKQCLYVDSSARNIAGARAAGLLGYRFTGVDSLPYLHEVFAKSA
jgi:putative hydrolase of the HAD superfamily